jgi:hypothetical protein
MKWYKNGLVLVLFPHLSFYLQLAQYLIVSLKYNNELMKF